MAAASPELDVLIVGSGPTGLSLAAQLTRFGLHFRIVDALPDRRHESRALAVQARSLELLDSIGLADALVARGRRAVRVRLHVGDTGVVVPTDMDRHDTRFPFVLFVSQDETERVLAEWLERQGVAIERGCRAAVLDGIDGDAVRCELAHADGRNEVVSARYVAGCDGAHSTVRHAAALSFDGDAYPQQFMLADLEIDGPLEADSVNVFPGVGGGLLILPLGVPRTWRLIAIDPSDSESELSPEESALGLDELQAFVDRIAGTGLRLRDAAWLTRFRLHHRQVSDYRHGRLFVAGDAAHIHSPAGGQGMNTGIQDAWNLGWKLGLVCRARAPEILLDTYHDERWPVGRYLLRFTDRLFAIAARALAAGPAAARLRNLTVRTLLPIVAASPSLRQRGFHRVSQLGIRYRRSRAVREGTPALLRGPRAGDRLPNLPGVIDGTMTTLHEATRAASFHLLWCSAGEPTREVRTLLAGRPIAVHHLRPDPAPSTDTALAGLGLEPAESGLYLVRPDGHVAYRCAGTDTDDLSRYVADWLRVG